MADYRTNVGFKASSGAYIALVDSDDLIAQALLKNFMNAV